MIRIISKQDGFRRCGIAHPAAVTDYPDDRFSDDELAILKNEPMLIVQVLPDMETGGPDGSAPVPGSKSKAKP